MQDLIKKINYSFCVIAIIGLCFSFLAPLNTNAQTAAKSAKPRIILKVVKFDAKNSVWGDWAVRRVGYDQVLELKDCNQNVGLGGIFDVRHFCNNLETNADFNTVILESKVYSINWANKTNQEKNKLSRDYDYITKNRGQVDGFSLRNLNFRMANCNKNLKNCDVEKREQVYEEQITDLRFVREGKDARYKVVVNDPDKENVFVKNQAKKGADKANKTKPEKNKNKNGKTVKVKENSFDYNKDTKKWEVYTGNANEYVTYNCNSENYLPTVNKVCGTVTQNTAGNVTYLYTATYYHCFTDSEKLTYSDMYRNMGYTRENGEFTCMVLAPVYYYNNTNNTNKWEKAETTDVQGETMPSVPEISFLNPSIIK
jgi:hypothetical protein